ncbi:MAG: arginine--tRNA ligase [Candidatus Magasanikbacteria bacterium]|nr:arginine--tRNA ligase [Candidatus Magasanikbacteria bacterium]
MIISSLRDKIEEILEKEHGQLKKGVSVEIPPPNFGDFAINCHSLRKILGMDSSDSVMDVVEHLYNELKREEKKEEWLFHVTPEKHGYVSFFVDYYKLAFFVFKKINEEGDKYGLGNVGNGKKVMIEYPSQNTHKEFHIGHLRNVCIGNCLVELYKKSGFEVIPVNYLNDFGRHVVKCLWAIQKFHKDEEPSDNKQKWLGQVYAEAEEKLKDNEGAKEELDELQKKLEDHDPEIWELFKKTRDWSVEGFDRILAELGTKHEKVFFESDIKEKGQKIVDELLKKDIAKEGEGGAIIVDLEDDSLDIALIRKSSGAGVYMTSDLALAKEKFENYDVEESINITGNEQDFYFKQLFKILELYGFKPKMTHIGYGLVNLPSGKMSSRKGNVILYEDLRDQVMDKMLRETKKRHDDWDEEKIKNNAEKLTQAVLKFTMQKHESNKVVSFDFDEAVSFEGFSAPYILYVVARINSLLKKSKAESRKPKVNFSLLEEVEEKRLLLLIAEYPEIIKKALERYNPSTITKYCFDLAKAFNDYYNKYRITDAESEELVRMRMAVCGSVKFVLENALNLLSIETVEEM